jgi:hypothetical protein
VRFIPDQRSAVFEDLHPEIDHLAGIFLDGIDRLDAQDQYE